jgi:DNA transposition AAA+ family ATPase
MATALTERSPHRECKPVIRHYLNLEGASVLETTHLVMTEQAILDLIRHEAMGAVVGYSGLGKTFAIDCALAQIDQPVIRLTFETRPTLRLIADRLWHQITGEPTPRTRFDITNLLIDRLAEERYLIVIGEAQNLNRDCFELLRHLHDLPKTHFSLLFDGGDGCWEVIAREQMLKTRIYRRVAFAPLSTDAVIELIPSYHAIYSGVSDDLVASIDRRAAHGRLRAWARFTHTAATICETVGADRIDDNITDAALTQIGTSDESRRDRRSRR